MPDDLRCVLQNIRQSRLKNYPGTFGPEQDICDITLWLNQRFPLSKARVLVERHYTQRGREIAGLTVTCSAAQSASLAPLALEAFLALGYQIQETGGDSYQCPSCYGYHSRHEALKAYERIESGRQVWRPR
jgi:hypothetical protein